MDSIDLDRATEIAEEKLARSPEHDFVVDSNRIEEHPFGWVFVYAPRRFLETGDTRYAVPGTGPLVVNRDGTTEFLPSMYDHDVAVEQYQREWEARNRE